MVFFQLLHIGSNSSPKELGYFSSLSDIQYAKSILNGKPGFSVNSDGYVVIRRNSTNVLSDRIFFEALVYYHSEDYAVEYSTSLGIFNSEEQAQTAINDFDELNPTEVSGIICERIVNRCIFNKIMWTEGFDCENSWTEVR